MIVIYFSRLAVVDNVFDLDSDKKVEIKRIRVLYVGGKTILKDVLDISQYILQ